MYTSLDYTQYMQLAYFARYNLFFINTGLHTHSIYPGQSHTSSKAITLLVSVTVHYHTEGHRRVNVLSCVCSLLYHEWCTHIVSTSYTVPCGEQIGYVLKYTKQKTLHYIDYRIYALAEQYLQKQTTLKYISNFKHIYIV